MSRIFLIVFLSLILSDALLGQQSTDSLKLSSFRKGRNYAGIAGSVSSSSLNGLQNYGGQDQIGNEYSFGIKLGKFVAAKNLLGVSFSANRSHTLGYTEIRAEVLNIGPWYRIYLGKHPEISFYLQTAVLYSSYNGLSSGLRSFVAIDESLRAIGVSVDLGLGVVYVISDVVSFEVGVDFTEGNYWGEISDNLTNDVNDITVDLSEFSFSFGFAVLFGKIKDR